MNVNDEPKTRYCPYCGRWIDESHQYPFCCYNCGAILEHPTEAEHSFGYYSDIARNKLRVPPKTSSAKAADLAFELIKQEAMKNPLYAPQAREKYLAEVEKRKQERAEYVKKNGLDWVKKPSLSSSLFGKWFG